MNKNMNSTILAFLRIIGALQKKLHSSSDAECKHNKIAKQQNPKTPRGRVLIDGYTNF